MHRNNSGFLKLAVMASTLLWASMTVTPAMATDVLFNFSGIVTDSQLPTSTFLGQAVGASLTYTPGVAPDTNGASNIGKYNSVITSLNLTIGGPGGYDAVLLPGGGPNFVQITNFGTFDQYVIRAPIFAPTEPLVNGDYFPSFFEIKFIHEPGIFGNNATAPPTLGFASFSPTFRLVFDNGVPKDVTGPGALTAVPLPPAVILFGAGLVALIGLGARNWQRKTVGGMRLEV